MGTEEKVVQIEVDRLRDFPNHPFCVKDDDEMKELMESIAKEGIVMPLIVRNKSECEYEIISGHRRAFAAKILGLTTVPALVRNLDRDDAIIVMVNSNLHRERLLPSEKAYSYKMKYEAIRQKSGRRKKGEQQGPKKKSIDIVSEEGGDSPKQVQRYLRLAELIPELLKRVDEDMMGITPAVEISYLTEQEQRDLADVMEYTQCSPSLSQAIRLRALSQKHTLNYEVMEEILNELKQRDVERVVFKNQQLYRFFPTSYSAKQMQREIIKILKQWMKSNENSYEEEKVCAK